MTDTIFQTYFGFSGVPFALPPDPSFMFWTSQHSKAFTVIEYGLVTGAAVTVLTGEVGAGKTTLMHALLKSLPDDTRVGLISNSGMAGADLMRWIASALEIKLQDPNDAVQVFNDFQNHLVEEFAHGRRVVLIFDEAQNLGPDRLEELRMLTNVNSGTDDLLQLILIGQPELREILSRHSLRQFAQRVSVFFHLKEMDLSTTRKYVCHRLRHVGGTGTEISDDAVSLIHEKSGGVPRMVNKFCELSLVYAAGADKKSVDQAIVQEVLDDGLVLLPTQPLPVDADDVTEAPAAAPLPFGRKTGAAE